jgi:hypothetical protein
MQHYHWSLEFLEEITPLERQIYLDLLQRWVREENARIEKLNGRY